MERHVVLVVEGGGAKMPYETAQIEHIERQTNKRITDLIDMAVTTSAGSVVMSCLSLGMACEEFNGILMGRRGESDRKTAAVIKRMFTKRGFLKVPLYPRKPYVDVHAKHFGGGALLGDSVVPFICTSVDEVGGRTHFFKSWEAKDGGLGMAEAACRSFAAMWFFGEMLDTDRGKIWTDGGVGIFNLPLTKAYVQARANGWLNEGHHTHILAICSGYAYYGTPYGKYKRLRTGIGRALKGMKFFVNPGEGGGARAMCTMEQIREMQFNAKSYTGTDGQGKLTFQHITWPHMPRKLDAMDNWKARWRYYDRGRIDAGAIDIKALLKG